MENTPKKKNRRVVQSGRMHALGACGCKFKSCHADQGEAEHVASPTDCKSAG